MRAYGLLVAIVAAGCGFDHGKAVHDGGLVTSGDAPDGSMEIDASPDAFDPLCFGKDPFAICLTQMPSGSLEINGVDTDGETTCGDGRGTTMMIGTTPVAACVIAADRIELGDDPDVGVSGDKPLVLLAVSSLRINAGSTLDITSGRIAGNGPGANPDDCGSAAAIAGTDGSGGGAGGAGGSFGAAGGTGAPGAAGTGGTPHPPAAVPVDKLRGGCPGGSGGDGDGGIPDRARGGSGGGAVYLLSRGDLFIDGVVNASGAGGTGGTTSKCGGGGGGSGGMIVIHAGSLHIGPGARIFANGGGGGAGAGNSFAGGSGDDGEELDTAAAGGSGGTGGTTPGGPGGFQAIAAGSATNDTNGGAAGGGGVGVIRVLSGQSISANNVSPAPLLN